MEVKINNENEKSQFMRDQAKKTTNFEQMLKSEYDLKFQKMNLELQSKYKEIGTLNEIHHKDTKDFQKRLSKSVDSEFKLQKEVEAERERVAKKENQLAKKTEEI